MLLDIQRLAANANGTGKALMGKVAGALRDSARDIDQRGWYVQDHVMGVIFSELNDQDFVQARDLVAERSPVSARPSARRISGRSKQYACVSGTSIRPVTGPHRGGF